MMGVQAALLPPSLSYLVRELNNSPENKSHVKMALLLIKWRYTF